MDHGDWDGRDVLVLGVGDTGLSCIRWLARRGARVRCADTRDVPPRLAQAQSAVPGLRCATGPFAPQLLEGIDTVVTSPGLGLGEPLLRTAAARGVPVVGDVEIFARELARFAPEALVIGVTGTNGKSTVTALAGEMVRACGKRTVVAGNIGLPVLDALPVARDGAYAEAYVLEVSSYQLEVTESLRLTAATMLNLTQDHLDRHGSIEGYAAAKARIFQRCGTRVVNRDDPWSLGMAAGSTVSFGLGEPRGPGEWGVVGETLVEGHEPILSRGDIPIPGLHNVANVLAAHALCRSADLPRAPLAEAIRRFQGLPHRVQLVGEARGVRFYDDSKGTNVGATVAALEGFDRPVVLIAGGDGKGQDFSPLAPAASGRTRAAVLIGRDGPAVGAVLGRAGVRCESSSSIEAATEAAFALAQPGDAVLLSPACASLDMFANYRARGEAFAAAARAIAARQGG